MGLAGCASLQNLGPGPRNLVKRSVEDRPSSVLGAFRLLSLICKMSDYITHLIGSW